MSGPPASDDIAAPAPSEEPPGLLIELVPDAVLVIAGAKVVFANPAALRLFRAGTGPGLIGRKVADLAEDPALGLRLIGPAPGPAADRIVSGRLLRLDGAPFAAELTARDIVFRGQPSRIVVIRDVTERTRQNEQAGRAARQSLAKRLAQVRHDLLQPLNAIRLTAEGALLMIERDRIPTEGWPDSQFALIADQSEQIARMLEGLRIERPAAASAAAAPQLAGAHILVVEADSAAALALCSYLTGQGCRVSLTGSGGEAWDRFRNDPADIVITDRAVFGGEDEDLIAALRDFDPLLPIIVVTDRADEADRIDPRYRDDRCILLKKPTLFPKIGRLIAAFLLPPSEEPVPSP